jgi:DNA repair photolyase
VERRLGITRQILEVLAECRHPVTVVTKSNLVLRDADLLKAMAAKRRAMVYVSITTLDRTLARRMEPRAPTPERRLATVAGLAEAGVPVGVLASPMIPDLNEAELERVLEAAAAAGAVTAGYILIRLPYELKRIFEDWLTAHYPTKAAKVLAALREMRGGQLNDPRFAHRMRGAGPRAELLARRFELACRRLSLDHDPPPLDTSVFRRPLPATGQRALFD